MCALAKCPVLIPADKYLQRIGAFIRVSLSLSLFQRVTKNIATEYLVPSFDASVAGFVFIEVIRHWKSMEVRLCRSMKQMMKRHLSLWLPFSL